MNQEMKNRKSKTFWLSLATTISFFIVNIAGFVDTMTASTVGCGKSWPLCNGSIMPWNWDYHAWIEFGHRFLVFLASVLLVTLAIVAWRKYGAYKIVRVLISLAILGVVLESFLGAMAVFFSSPPALLAVHMGIALLSFGSLTGLTVLIRQIDIPEVIPNTVVPRKIARYTWFTFFFLYIAIYFGSYVASRGVGGAFKGFPIPTESYVLAGSAFIIDVIHRSFALGLLLLLIGLTVITQRIKKQRPDLYKGSITALILVCLQGLSGALLVYSHLSFYSIIIHVSVVSLLFGMMSILGIQCMKRPQPQGKPSRIKKEKERMDQQYSKEATSNI